MKRALLYLLQICSERASYHREGDACFLFTLILICFLFTSCTPPLLQTDPEMLTDSSTVTITCNTAKGNRGLEGFSGPVFVHLGLITDSSEHINSWRYVKFPWGSTEEQARANKVGNSQWSYTIPNLRRFFGVADRERILNLAILFRSGNCLDTFCKVQRNEDGSDIILPVNQQ